MAYETTLPPRPHKGRLTQEEEEAYVSSLDDAQKAMYEERKVTRIAGRVGRPSRSGSIEDDLSMSEIRDTIRYIFEGAGEVLQSEATWSDEEFTNIARGIHTIVNKFRPLKIVFRFLTPVSSVAQLLKKVRKLMNGRKQQDNPSS